MMIVINESPSVNNDEKTKSSRSIPRTEKEIVTHFVKDVRKKMVQKKSNVQSDEKNNSKVQRETIVICRKKSRLLVLLFKIL